MGLLVAAGQVQASLPKRAAFYGLADSLALAHSLQSKGRYADIIRMMAAYGKAHPTNGYAEWLWADALSKQGKMAKAVRHYRHAKDLLGQASGEANFRLSYTRALLMASHMQEAAGQLDTLDRGGYRYPEITALRARLVLWQGRLSEGQYQVEKLAHLDKQNPELTALAAEVHQATAPWVQVGIANRQDNQPLQGLAPTLEAGYYRSAAWQPKITLSAPVYTRDGQNKTAFSGSIGNSVYNWRTGTTLSLTVGFIKFPKGTTAPIGSVLLRQGLVGKLALELQAERASNLTTRASLDTALLYNRYAASLVLRPSKWAMGQATAEGQSYADGNTVTLAYAYLLGPRITVGKLEARVGYSYAYADASQSRFVPQSSLTDIVAGWGSSTFITGYYSPYFTPKDQKVQSLLAQVTVKPNAALELGASGSYGFSASNLNPYLTLSQGANDAYHTTVGFSRYTFTPYNAKVYVQWQLNGDQTIRLGAERLVNPFYTANILSASFRVLLK